MALLAMSILLKGGNKKSIFPVSATSSRDIVASAGLIARLVPQRIIHSDYFKLNSCDNTD